MKRSWRVRLLIVLISTAFCVQAFAAPRKGGCCRYGCCRCGCIAVVAGQEASLLAASTRGKLVSFTIDASDAVAPRSRWVCTRRAEKAVCTR